MAAAFFLAHGEIALGHSTSLLKVEAARFYSQISFTAVFEAVRLSLVFTNEIFLFCMGK